MTIDSLCIEKFEKLYQDEKIGRIYSASVSTTRMNSVDFNDCSANEIEIIETNEKISRSKLNGGGEM